MKAKTKISRLGFLAFFLVFFQIFFAASLPYGLPAFFVRWSSFFLSVSQVFLYRQAIRSFLGTIAPFSPLIVLGLFSGLTGYSPVASITGLVLFLQTAMAAVITARLGAQRSANAILVIGFVSILLGILVSILIPDFGTMQRGDAANWRGFSGNKNVFGWIGAVMGAAFLVLPTRFGWTFRIAGLVLCAVATVGSDSKTSLVALVIGIAFLVFLKLELRLRLSPAASAVVNFCFAFLFIAIGAAVALIVIPALGRDLTFTGRTVVWSAYLNDMADSLFFGKGPTAYSSPNIITEALSINSDFMGQTIETPHNLYIAMLGENGIIGLIALFGGFYYLMFVKPFGERLYAPVTAVFVMMLCVGGFQETHSPYSISLSWFLIFWSRALSLQAGEAQARQLRARREPGGLQRPIRKTLWPEPGGG